MLSDVQLDALRRVPRELSCQYGELGCLEAAAATDPVLRGGRESMGWQGYPSSRSILDCESSRAGSVEGHGHS